MWNILVWPSLENRSLLHHHIPLLQTSLSLIFHSSSLQDPNHLAKLAALTHESILAYHCNKLITLIQDVNDKGKLGKGVYGNSVLTT